MNDGTRESVRQWLARAKVDWGAFYRLTPLISLSILLLGMSAFCSCSNEQAEEQRRHSLAVRNGLTYPYIASPERQAQIRNGVTRVSTGMTPSGVESILGKPDEVRKLYDRIKNAETVGYTWWFIIQRKAETGSVADKAEKLVRVSFNLKDEVTRVDSWGNDDGGRFSFE